MDFQFHNIVSKILVLLALIIVGVTLWYTNSLANKFKIEQKKKVALWANATQELSDINNSNYDISFVFEVVNNNTTVPVIQTNANGDIIAHYRLIKQFKYEVISNHNLSKNSKFNYIIISRSKAFRRRLINETELLKKLSKHNFELIFFEDYSYQ